MTTEIDIPTQRKKLYVRGLSGLSNLGNTCYMNSILQCLSALDIFRVFVSDQTNFYSRLNANVANKLASIKRKHLSLPDNHPVPLKREMIKENYDDSLIVALSRLLTEMWKHNVEVTPRQFKKKIGESNEIFKGFSQNDSQEVLNLILDTIHEEIKAEVLVTFRNVPESVEQYLQVKKQCTEKANDEMLTIEDKQKYLDYLKKYTALHRDDMIVADAYAYWKNFIHKSHSIITDLFTGLFYSKITCTSCNAISGAFEPFTILSLQTKESGDTTLEESFDSFVKEELLCDDNQYFCCECKKKVDATKKMYIWSLPNILIIQLKRFKNNGMITSKTNSKVVFPIDNFDIKNYLSELYPTNNTTYNLVAVSEHRGSCNFGHYVAYCKNEINKLWYEFNDEDVFHVPYKDLEGEIITKNAYILFYKRII